MRFLRTLFWVVLAVFLAGFVPPFVVSRGQLWAMKRRLAGQGRPAEVLPNSPAVSPVEADVSHR
ncbi:MAG: hypothetical protein AVDCRST_MAG62-528 [uncultured Sphingomonas sp.]|uniref:Uncharacterized protein n=1 Tax=uncultured Sphingomonas sp. TaxID=158754 RepID=A0A6J4T1Z1_9SPHN|nr:MAG: hypothetical protein AVDCRST_MAG62-528 [uncultured Sphingomonas sp.]